MITIQIPASILGRSDIPAQYKLIYSVLKYYGADKLPLLISNAELVEIIGSDYRSITRCISFFERLGMITRKRIKGRENEYRIIS